MSLKDRINVELKEAMRNKDAVGRTVLRTMLSEIRNAEIAKKKKLDDEGILAVLTKQAQQSRDSIEAFESADRPDLDENETAELNIISSYLPERLSDSELRELIDAVFEEVNPEGPSDMGKVMGVIMQKVQGRADGKIISSIVSTKLREV